MRNKSIFLVAVLFAVSATVSRGQTTAEDFYKRAKERSKVNDFDGEIADYAESWREFILEWCCTDNTIDDTCNI